MKTLTEYFKTKFILEGGLAGHMSHIIDCNDYTCKDLKNLVKDLFSGKITDITEKTDGLQIMATLDFTGKVRFLRNQADLENGGMTLQDMGRKWTNPNIRDAYIESGKMIAKILETLPVNFFRPNAHTINAVNCECLNIKSENVILYGRNIVDIHNITVFITDSTGKWFKSDVTDVGMDQISDACKKVQNAWVSPKLIINTTEESQKLSEEYLKEIDKLFDKDDSMTIEAWKRDKFQELVEDEKSKWYWISDSVEGEEILYKRWFNGDKTTNLRTLKMIHYPKYSKELDELEKSKKWRDAVAQVLQPLDNLFLRIGNSAIKLCDGLLNSGAMGENAIKEISKRLKETIADIKANGVVSDQIKLARELARYEALGKNPINSTEGIVIKYNNKILKLTGTFAPLNKILGLTRFKK